MKLDVLRRFAQPRGFGFFRVGFFLILVYVLLSWSYIASSPKQPLRELSRARFWTCVAADAVLVALVLAHAVPFAVVCFRRYRGEPVPQRDWIGVLATVLLALAAVVARVLAA